MDFMSILSILLDIVEQPNNY
jgi:hypothetical protein